MRVDSARLHFLQIPLRISVTHGARSARTASDSIILALQDASGRVGYGEAVVRDYVSGPLDAPEARLLVARLLEPFRGVETSWAQARATLSALSCRPQELPFLCAVETALLDLACAEAGSDAYDVLGAAPLRQDVVYGGVIPIVPVAQADAWLERYMGFGFHEVKVKVGSDAAYNDAMLGVCRRRLGEDFPIRVDANASWSAETVGAHLAVCGRHRVMVVEQPLAAGAAAGAVRVLADARARGFSFMADEDVLGEPDVAALAAAGIFDTLNLRLSKNGGLTRVLALAGAAKSRGLRYQLGCMVGETAILSALGRIAACLLPSPLAIEGSYDDIILSDNVSANGIGFGPGGAASVIRGAGVGFSVDRQRLARLSARTVDC